MKRTFTASAGYTAVVVLLSIILFAGAGWAADLKPQTIKAWEQYIEEKETEATSSAGAPRVAATVAANDDRNFWTQMRNGEILVVPAGPNIPKRVPSGLIHDWIGTAFIPHATLPQVLAAIRDYARYKNMYRPGVVDSRGCTATENEDAFSLVLVNRSSFAKGALEGDFRAKYFRVDERRWYSIVESTRIQAIALSRDIPAALRWIIDPVVRCVSQEYVQLSLQKTRDAVESNRSRAIAAQKRQCTGVSGSRARR